MIINQKQATRGIGSVEQGSRITRERNLVGRGRTQRHFVVEHLEAGKVLDPRDQRDLVDRFGEEVISASLETLQAIRRLVEGRNHDNRHVLRRGVGLQAPAGFETIHARHHYVEEYHIDAFARANIKRFRTTERR